VLLKCPVCDLAVTRSHLAWKLETCPQCREEGKEVYLRERVGPHAQPIRRVRAEAESVRDALSSSLPSNAETTPI
jgi:Zn-finger nucleic acid-binding protein